MDGGSRTELEAEADGLQHRLGLIGDSLRHLGSNSRRKAALRSKCKGELEDAEKFINNVKSVSGTDFIISH